MISRTNIDLKDLRSDKVTCGICGEKFYLEDMTGKTVGIWFVICCEECKKEEQELGKVVYEPKNKKGGQSET